MAVSGPMVPPASTLMTTDQQTQTDDRIDTSDAADTQPTSEAVNGVATPPTTDADHVPVTALLAEERTVPFVGLTDAATRAWETRPVSPELRCGDHDSISLGKAISILPRASSGELWGINEFPVMRAGVAMALHRLLNEGTLLVKVHGELVEPHPSARLVITMNPPTREYRDSEPMNSATCGRFRALEHP